MVVDDIKDAAGRTVARVQVYSRCTVYIEAPDARERTPFAVSVAARAGVCDARVIAGYRTVYGDFVIRVGGPLSDTEDEDIRDAFKANQRHDRRTDEERADDIARARCRYCAELDCAGLDSCGSATVADLF